MRSYAAKKIFNITISKSLDTSKDLNYKISCQVSTISYSQDLTFFFFFSLRLQPRRRQGCAIKQISGRKSNRKHKSVNFDTVTDISERAWSPKRIRNRFRRILGCVCSHGRRVRQIRLCVQGHSDRYHQTRIWAYHRHGGVLERNWRKLRRHQLQPLLCPSWRWNWR